MPEHIRALGVIAVLAAVIFKLAEPALAPLMADEGAYKRRRNLWFMVVFAAFLAHNIWIYVALATVLVVRFGRDDSPLAVYALLLLAVPALDVQVPGFGLVNFIFDLNHVRLLNLAVLLPAAIRIARSDQPTPSHVRGPDYVVLAYIGLMFVLQARVADVTGLMRSTFYMGLDIWLPYFVASRSLRNLRAFRDVIASFVIGIAVLCPVAVFEMARRWLVYDSLNGALGLPPPPFGLYLTRGEGGMLRAIASSGNSIVLGYIMMTALSLAMFLLPNVQPRWRAGGMLATLGGGLVAALSRGPWVGAAAAIVVAMSLGEGGVGRLLKITAIGALGFGLLLLTPYGSSIVDHLPFIGTVDEGNVVYRQRLFELSMMVMWQSPLFGSFDYIMNPLLEEMRTGLGIIDIVNSYVAVALGYGMVGVTLFALPFLLGMWATWKALRHAGRMGSFEAERLGRVLLGTIAGMLITIATVSSIGIVPTLYWMVLGLAVGYSRCFGPDAVWATELQPAAAGVPSPYLRHPHAASFRPTRRRL